MPIATHDEFRARSADKDSLFDYLFVGGGTVGLVIVHRLTENIHLTAGVVEAGQDHDSFGKNPVIDTPDSLKTPQIFEFSGVGDPKILEPHDINCFVDLPGVGGNLQDHSSVSLTLEVDSKYLTTDVPFEPAELQRHQELFDKKENLLASASSRSFLSLSVNYLTSNTSSEKRYLTLTVSLMHPFSRGTVHHTSSPQSSEQGPSYPEIGLNVLSYPMDRQLKPVSVTRAQLTDILETHLRDYVRTIYHPLGTAVMMSREDGGVVDE
ncbi:Oxygen-dependent choline dehydrogenase [Leucoagaricus sp. SymC.cos]|nr:Oxygen-dependent choline dehydrogenase [Leucoagaricus sp. SymC.cos]